MDCNQLKNLATINFFFLISEYLESLKMHPIY